MYLDFQVQRFGKWRASAAARRLGSMALRLERLLFRDGLTFDEACGVLGNDPGVVETQEALDLIRRQLPARPSRRAGAGAGDEPVAREAPDEAAGHEERQALAERTFAAIGRSLARMPAKDRIFLRLHLESGFTVAEAARSLGLDQKALYRRKEDLLKAIRRDLAADGLGAEDAHDLLATLDWDAHLAADAEHISPPKNPPSRPSQGRGSSPPLESES
jgi:DNA-directed RNA polymerase specialized sigma24 family protein